MNTKHYTSIEQSKKLLELGLSPETADMYYPTLPKLQYPLMIPEDSHHIREDEIVTICWSLGALLELMPPYLFEWERGIDLNIYRSLNNKGWHISYMPNNINDMKKDKFRQITNGDSPIDAAFEMVCWLIEQKHIKVNK